MGWEDALALHRAGMDVQSHTRTHRVLHTLSPSDLRTELEGSRRDLEAALGAPVDAIAYPVGYRLAHLDHVRAALAAAGYRWGFTNQTGVNHVMLGVDNFDVNRISMSVDYSDALFRAMMALPYLAPLRRRPADLENGSEA
jgi:peptidoglycan/xylan/chitin deacetylase (PgdA/CDA1 family)